MSPERLEQLEEILQATDLSLGDWVDQHVAADHERLIFLRQNKIEITPEVWLGNGFNQKTDRPNTTKSRQAGRLKG